uniref:Uncharacterized protein n=1 Tax=viral metagenome TaxID=1070528 RepID=A0A6M3LS90_9ZZZZ
MAKLKECPLIIAGLDRKSKEGVTVCMACSITDRKCPMENDVLTEVYLMCPDCLAFDVAWLVNGKLEVTKQWMQKGNEIYHRKHDLRLVAPSKIFYTT